MKGAGIRRHLEGSLIFGRQTLAIDEILSHAGGNMRFAERSLRAPFLMMMILSLSVCLSADAWAQGKLEDYQRAQDLQARFQSLAVNVPGAANWIGKTHHFWYAKSVKGGTEFVLVDAEAATKKPAFDHEKLAAGINAASGGKFTALALPFAPPAGGRGGAGGGARGGAGGGASSPLNFVDQESAIEFGAGGFLYKCTLADYKCTKGAAIQQPAAAGRGGRGEVPEDISAAVNDNLPAPMETGGDPVDGLAYEPLAPPQGGGMGGGRGQGGCAPRPQAQAAAQVQGRGAAAGGGRGGAQSPAESQVCGSFDGKWEAIILNYNVFLRPAGSNDIAAAKPLSTDGSEGNYYTFRSIAWSPDSKKLVAYHTRPGYDRQVHYIESSPADQVQPKHTSILYRKPGDALDIAYPALFDVATRKGIDIDRALFPNAYDIATPVWWRDSRAFTFEYNQRGHQVYRVIEVDAQSGKARALISEESKTFIYYNSLGPGLSAGRRYRYDLADGKEIIWASERDGWEHLYLYDGVTGQVKNQITKGNWVVRNVDRVDEEKRQIWFEAGGMNPKQDPYFTHYYRINFDGTGLVALTQEDGNHSISFPSGGGRGGGGGFAAAGAPANSFSADSMFYVDTWQRIDMPPVSQLRRTDDQKLVLDLEKGDASALIAAGYKVPEVFVAKGRDGTTDIWGIIVRPTNFDAAKKYPVIENIYAGPQGSFVPKNWNGAAGMQALAELGFIVVQIDGMGTNNRSKAFHDFCWKNLGDAGFPDRILWHKAAAAKYPWYDISRVGIYGTSAGGQNAMGAMLFHPDFYKVSVTNSGCHDNRMDKIWWNEQWMGWPIGPEYAASSNVDNAYKLQGKVLIIIGEMDSNVDPASSLQVVNALVHAEPQPRHFDMLYIPGQNHGVGVLSSQHYLQDYFVRNLLGVEPPDWNKQTLKERAPGN
jgi:dipeptidyl aminopeptidase/acylaminoacyl peptidase